MQLDSETKCENVRDKWSWSSLPQQESCPARNSTRCVDDDAWFLPFDADIVDNMCTKSCGMLSSYFLPITAWKCCSVSEFSLEKSADQIVPKINLMAFSHCKYFLRPEVWRDTDGKYCVHFWEKNVKIVENLHCVKKTIFIPFNGNSHLKNNRVMHLFILFNANHHLKNNRVMYLHWRCSTRWRYLRMLTLKNSWKMWVFWPPGLIRWTWKLAQKSTPQ